MSLRNDGSPAHSICRPRTGTYDIVRAGAGAGSDAAGNTAAAVSKRIVVR